MWKDQSNISYTKYILLYIIIKAWFSLGKERWNCGEQAEKRDDCILLYRSLQVLKDARQNSLRIYLE